MIIMTFRAAIRCIVGHQSMHKLLFFFPKTRLKLNEITLCAFSDLNWIIRGTISLSSCLRVLRLARVLVKIRTQIYKIYNNVMYIIISYISV